MYICPLCNGLRSFHYTCPTCKQLLRDNGRVIDYFDDYSAYMEIDEMKKNDGYKTTLSQHECAHLFYCQACGNEEVKLIKE